MTDLTCLDANPEDPCEGEVLWTTTPDRGDFKHFPRCVKHHARRLEQAEETMRKYPTLPPSDFDPGYAGERWDEE